MIRQPEFVTEDVVKKAFEIARKKKAHPLFKEKVFDRMNKSRFTT